MKTRSRFVFIGLLVIMALSLVGVLPAAAAPSLPVGTGAKVAPSATTASLGVSTNWVKPTKAGAFEITVNDPDRKSTTTQTAEATQFSGAVYSYATAGGAQFFRTQKFPVGDTNGDGNINFQDLTIVNDSDGATTATGEVATLSVQTLGSADGGFNVVRATAPSAAIAFRVTYKANSINNIGTGGDNGAAGSTGFLAGTALAGQVKITSSTHATGIYGVLRQTGPDTGVYKATIDTSSSADSAIAVTSDGAAKAGTITTNGIIKVSSGDIITIKYVDPDASGGGSNTQAVTVRVDGTAPTVANLAPADATLTKETLPHFIADVTDAESGIDDTTVVLVTASTVDGAGAAVTTNMTKTAISGGWHVDLVPTAALTANANTFWRVEVMDKAGNTGKSDADAVTAGTQNHKLSVRTTAPIPQFAKTGDFWDTSKSPAQNNLGKSTSIRVNFDAEIDPASVDASDFTVNGVAPSSAFTPVVGDTSGIASATAKAAAELGKMSVYLTVAAQATDARPDVRVVGTVLDKAGNQATATTLTDVRDGLSPAVTVSYDNQKISSNIAAVSKVIVTIQVDESLGAAPTVKATTDPGANLDTSAHIDALATLGVTPVLISTNLYQVQIPATSLTGDADNFLAIIAQDVSGNKTRKTALPNNDLIKITVDNTVVAPVFDPVWASGTPPTEIEQTTKFIRATYTEKITPIASSFNGVNVLSQVIGSQDGKVWTYIAKDLAVDSINSFKITAKDGIGNIGSSQETRFKVIEPKGTTVQMFAGWNLISVPDNLKDPTVDVVFTGLKVTLVMTYDQAAGWLTATKDPTTGNFVGSLTKVETGKGYFVFADGPQTLKVFTVVRAPTDLPPQIALKKGWNLIGYTSLPKVDGLKATSYLYGARWTNLYSFSPDPAVGYQYARPSAGTVGNITTAVASALFDVDAGANPVMKLGRGYWIYAESDTTITP